MDNQPPRTAAEWREYVAQADRRLALAKQNPAVMDYLACENAATMARIDYMIWQNLHGGECK